MRGCEDTHGRRGDTCTTAALTHHRPLEHHHKHKDLGKEGHTQLPKVPVGVVESKEELIQNICSCTVNTHRLIEQRTGKPSTFSMSRVFANMLTQTKSLCSDTAFFLFFFVLGFFFLQLIREASI